MKRVGVCVVLSVLAAFTAAGAGDVLQQLSVSKADAASDLLQAFGYGNVNFYRVRSAFKSATPAARVALTEQVLIWTKAYVSSPQFAKEYATFRDELKPEGASSGLSVDEELAQRRAQRKAELEEAKKNIPAETYKAMAETRKELDTPEYRKMEREMLIEERKAQSEENSGDAADWEKQYPADHRVLVKRRLQQFLSETESVDYGAQLVSKNGKMRFANGAYEGKSSEWKLAYRAGKETTDKARAFAKAWLAEMK